MAANACKAPFLRVIAKRGFAASACPRPLGHTAEVETCILPNKVIVASAESVLPIARVSVIFRAGSRNESYENQGASHMLRIATGLSTKNSSGFAITRNIQQVGGSLTTTADREVVSYTVEMTSDKIETGLRYLQDVIEPAFKPWELADAVPRVRWHVAAVPPQVRAVELMHRAAFRTGLGNSIFIPKFQIGKLSSESLLHYVANNCTANRCAVVGVGINHNMLSGFAQSLELGTSSSKSDSANYYGGDARKDTPGNIAHVAVGGQGGCLLNQKEALTFAVLQASVGSPAPTTHGNMNGSLGKALASAIGDAPASFAALNASYTDAGIFGFVISTESHVIGKAVDAVARAMKSASISADDVNRGKAVLKSHILESYSTDRALIAEISNQALLTKQVMTADALIAAVDGITQKDVQDAARKAGSSKLSIGAVGNLAHVPHSTDLV